MPRSSRHKSSKHSSRDARDYSETEKDSTLRERKNKEESGTTVSKESGSSGKRKFDNKEHYDSPNREYYEERTSSKRHREKIQDSSNGRWNGGDDERGETSKKSKMEKISEMSRRREEVEGEDTKKSSEKHRESSRTESRVIEKDRDKGRDRKFKEGKTDKIFDAEDHHGSKIVPGKTEAQDEVQIPGSENYPEKRSRPKMEDHGIGHKHQGSIGDVSDRGFSSANDCLKDGKQKEEKCKDKNRVGTEEANKERGDKQRDDRPNKEHPRSDGKDFCESKRKKTKFQENDQDKEHGHEPDNGVDGYHERPCEYERNKDYEREYDRRRDRDRDRDRDLDHRDQEHDRDLERDRDRGQSRDHDWDHYRDRLCDQEKDDSRHYYHDRERNKTEHERESYRDVSYLDQTGQYKDCKERRRSPDDQDDLSDSKSKITRAHTDMVTRGTRRQPDCDSTRSQRQPSSSVVQEEIGFNMDQKAKWISYREATDLSGGSERGFKNSVSENMIKMKDGSVGEFQVERSSSMKASPRPLEQNYINPVLEVEETGQRNITRDFPAFEAGRILVDVSPQAEVSVNNKPNQISSSFPPRPESRGGISSPIVGTLEGDSRASIAGRYKRGGVANMGRGQQRNVWRASPNWPSPVIPNGFIPIQYGLPHGGFQSMVPQFPSPSLFGVRPSMEMSHSGIPYHITNAERFSSHLNPFGWQNMMDVSGPHMHGFFGDMSNGNCREESRMYGAAEWDHNRQMQGQGWDSGADAWKTQNGNMSMDISSMSVNDDNSAQALKGDPPAVQTSYSYNNRAKIVEAGSNVTSPAKELAVSSLKVLLKEVYEEDTVAETMDSVERYCQHYLSKIDISVKLTDTELYTQCMGLLKCEEGCQTSDDVIAVFVNLKEGGRTVPKAHSSSLTSLIPTENNLVFEIAMELYKEQRYEMKSLPDVKYERPPPQVSPPNLEDDLKINMEVDDRLLETGDA